MQLLVHTPQWLAACEQPGANISFLSKTRRNQLLTQCDWTQAMDSPLTAEQKAAWATYRQALRDITKQEGFPENVQWPSTPSA
jgi:hypothetical protein